ncbi:MAG: PLP-dependent cysteine synthase family protein, partial [Candidatus Geothermarchaeales archaeon]
KAEWYNPSGSVKDRPVLSILRDAEERGLLTEDKTVLDATSGNAGASYAMLGSVLGYEVCLTTPRNASEERIAMMKAFGAEVVFTSALEGSDGAILKAQEIHRGNPDRYFYGDQYSNEANWRAHYETTGEEIIQQMNGELTYFVAGLGTGGTFVGVGRRLREHDSGIRLVAVEPDSGFHGIEGLKHMESSLKPSIYDPSLADDVLRVSTEEAQGMIKKLAREEGLLVGVSSGAALAAALRVAETLDEGRVVTVFPDAGSRFLPDRFWGDRAR